MKQLAASTIAEVVIALTIIAICFTVASQVFMQSNRSTIQFKEAKEQTEFQSWMLDAMVRDSLPEANAWKGDITTVSMTSEKAAVKTYTFELANGGKKVWEQELYHE